MEELIKLGLMFFAESRGNRRGGTAGRVTAAALCSGFAVVTVAAGVACAVAALWIYLVPVIGAAGAALTAAGIFLIVSGILMFVARNMLQPYHQAVPVKTVPLAEELLGQFRDGFERNKGASLLAALVAGLTAGAATGK